MGEFERVREAQIVAWLGRLFAHEGGFTLDKHDPGNWTGGKPNEGQLKGTRFGISAASYPRVDIKNLTIEQAAEIYRYDFLIPLRAERYRDGVGFQLLDFAVNSGPGRATRKLQKAIGVKADGAVGPLTLSRLMALSESDVIMLVLAERIDFMCGLRNWPHHGKGWMRRIAKNLRYGAEDS